MTNNQTALPDSDACAIILRDTLDIANNAMLSYSRRITDPLMNPINYIGDDHDYIPAASRISAAIIFAIFNDHDDFRAALSALLADDEFLEDCMTCDFTAPIHDFIDEDID